jgi:hypothetical protein
MKKNSKVLSNIIILFLAISPLFAQGDQKNRSVTSKSKTLIYSYDNSRDAIYPHIVKLQGKKHSCSVRFAISYIDPYETDCIEKENSKEETIFCPKDKSICKTLAEVSYFSVTKRELKEKKNKKIPFVGKRYFNFLGGSGTGESIEISANGDVVYMSHGVISSGITWKGKFSDSKNSHFVEKDVVCMYNDKKKLSICTGLYK